MDFQNFYDDLIRLDTSIYDVSLPPKAVTDMTSNLDGVELGCISRAFVPGFMWPSQRSSPICKDDIFLNEFNANTHNGTAASSGPNGLTPIYMSEPFSTTDENESPNLPPSSVVPCDELYSSANDDMLSDTTGTMLYESEMSFQKEMNTSVTKAQSVSSCSDDKTDSSVTYSPPLSYESDHQEAMPARHLSNPNFSAISFYDEDYDMVSANTTELDKTTDMDISSDDCYKDIKYLCQRLTELLHKLERHNNTNTTSDSTLLAGIETEYDKEIKHACSFSKSGNHQHQIKTLQLLNSVMDAYLIALQITGSHGDLKALSLSRDNSLNTMDSSEEQHSYDNSDATYSLGFTSTFSIQAVSVNEDDGNEENAIEQGIDDGDDIELGNDGGDDDDDGDDDYELAGRKSKKRARRTKSNKNKKQKKLGTGARNKVTKKTCRSNKTKQKALKEAVVTSPTTEYEDEDSDSYKKRSRQNYSLDITTILMDWYLAHEGTPPTMEEKLVLVKETKKSIGQGNFFFKKKKKYK
jgi:hypothetical protein